jgi:SulP family sulfate permease
VYSIEGPLFFGAVERFERVLAQTHADPRWMILRLGRVPFMDATGLQTLQEVIGKLTRRGVRVLLTEANERVLAKLQRMGILQQGDSAPIHFGDLHAATRFASSQRQEPATAP